MSEASSNGNLPVCEFLVGAGAKVDHADKDGFTPLSIASVKGHLPVCEFLVGAGAKVDHADTNGRTPLCLASQNGETSIVQLLLVQGANYYYKANDGRTPNKKAIYDIIDRWPSTMAILCLQELSVYHWLDMSLIDLFEFIGQEKDFL